MAQKSEKAIRERVLSRLITLCKKFDREPFERVVEA
jgi:hypothetical protein